MDHSRRHLSVDESQWATVTPARLPANHFIRFKSNQIKHLLAHSIQMTRQNDNARAGQKGHKALTTALRTT